MAWGSLTHTLERSHPARPAARPAPPGRTRPPTITRVPVRRRMRARPRSRPLTLGYARSVTRSSAPARPFAPSPPAHPHNRPQNNRKSDPESTHCARAPRRRVRWRIGKGVSPRAVRVQPAEGPVHTRLQHCRRLRRVISLRSRSHRSLGMRARSRACTHPVCEHGVPLCTPHTTQPCYHAIPSPRHPQ